MCTEFLFPYIPLLGATPTLQIKTCDFSAGESFPAPEDKMASPLKDFIDQPALEKIDDFKKDELLAIGRHFKIPLKQKERKAELKKKLTDELLARGAQIGGPGRAPDLLVVKEKTRQKQLDLERKKVDLEIQREQRRQKELEVEMQRLCLEDP